MHNYNFKSEAANFKSFLQTGETKLMSVSNDISGGFLVPQQLHNQIISKIIEVSPMRALSRVVQVSGGGLEVPVGVSDLSTQFVGEGDSVSVSDPQFGKVIIKANKLQAIITITRELLEDSSFDMQQEILTRAALKFAQVEGEAFINGTSPNEPQGLVQAAGLINVNSGSATALTADAFFDMFGAFKYRNPTFIMNRATFAEARKLKNGTGNYLLQDGLNGPSFNGIESPGMIAGVPVVIMQDMPDIGAGNVPVAMIDANNSYMIAQGALMSAVRDDFTLSSEDKVRFIITARVGGAVVLPDSVVTMTIAA